MKSPLKLLKAAKQRRNIYLLVIQVLENQCWLKVWLKFLHESLEDSFNLSECEDNNHPLIRSVPVI